MELEYAGVTFDVMYQGGSRGSATEAPYGPSAESGDGYVSDWDELAACHGLKSGDYIPCVSLDDLMNKISERNYDRMIEDCEEARRDDFDPPDDDDECDW